MREIIQFIAIFLISSTYLVRVFKRDYIITYVIHKEVIGNRYNAYVSVWTFPFMNIENKSKNIISALSVFHNKYNGANVVKEYFCIESITEV